MGKRIDYDALIAFYHRLNLCRKLAPHESDRLDEILRKKMSAEAQRRYREKNAEKLDEKRREWNKVNRERATARMAQYRAEKPHKIRDACRRYRDRLRSETTEKGD